MKYLFSTKTLSSHRRVISAIHIVVYMQSFFDFVYALYTPYNECIEDQTPVKQASASQLLFIHIAT